MRNNIEITLKGIGNLEISSKLLDTFGLEINYNLSDINDFSSRSSNYSKSFKIFGTPKNNKILEHVYDINFSSLTYDLNAKIPATLTVNKNVFVDGYLKIRSISRTFIAGKFQIVYDLNIYDDLKSIFIDLEDKNLQDLDFSESFTFNSNTYAAGNHTFGWDAIIASLNRGSNVNNVFDYAMINYNFNGVNNGTSFPAYSTTSAGVYNAPAQSLVLSHFYPSVYVKAILDKIFYEYGYTYTSNFFDGFTNDALFSKLITIYNGADMLVDTVPNFVGGFYGTSFEYDNTGATLTEEPEEKDFLKVPVEFKMSEQSEFFFLDDNNYGDTINIKSNGNYTLAFEFDINSDNSYYYDDGTGSPIDYKTFITVVKNGDQELSRISLADYTFPDTISFEESYDLTKDDAIQVIVNVGYQNEYLAEWDGAKTACIPTSSFDITLDINYEDVEDKTDTELNLADFLPDMTQTQFLKNLIKWFNLYIEVDKENSKNLIIETRDYFLNGDIINWSDKVNYNKPVKIEPTNKIINNTYNFKMNEMESLKNTIYYDKYGETYGDFILEGNLNSDKTKTIESGFGGFNSTTVGQFKLANLVKENTSGLATVKSEIEPCIGIYEDNVNNDPVEINLFSIDEDVAAVRTVTHYNDTYNIFYNTEGIDSPNAYENFWRREVTNLLDNNNRIITYYFDLSFVDIINLDFKRPILINNDLYYLQKLVVDVVNSNSAKATLIKAYDYIKYTEPFEYDFIYGAYELGSVLPAGVNRPTVNTALLESGISSIKNTVADITLNLSVTLTQYLWFATPANNPAHARNSWYIDVWNNGDIGGEEDLGGNLFPDPITFEYNGIDYWVYVANYQTEIDPIITLKG